MKDTRIIVRDNDLGALENAFKKSLLQKRYIFSVSAFTGTPNSGMEDMFDQEFYLSLVNAEYADNLSKPIKKGHLSGGAPIT